MPEILITNDDGVMSPGLEALIGPLAELGTVHVVAPHANRSAVARAITIHNPLHVRRVTLPGVEAFSCDGTPVDCVRLAALGLTGINHGVNMGDDVTYSGTVGAALEGMMCGWLAVAASCQARGNPPDRWLGEHFDFASVAQAVADLVAAGLRGDIPRDVTYNVNGPAEVSSRPAVVTSTRLGRRIYNDELKPHPPGDDGVHYDIYNAAPGHHEEEGTDFAALLRGEISVTPIALRLTADEAVAPLAAALDGVKARGL